MKKRNKIVLINILSAVLIQGVTFLSAPIFSRMLGTANYGVVAMYHTWGEIMSIIFPLQVNATLHMARNRFPLEEQARYQSAAMSAGTLGYLLFAAVCLLFLQLLAGVLKMEPAMLCVLIVFSFGQFCVSFLNAKFSYEFKAGRNLLLSVFAVTGSVALSVLFVSGMPEDSNYWGRILGEAAVYALLIPVAFFILFSKGKTVFRRDYWQFALMLGLPLVFHALSSTLLAQSDRIMVRMLGTESEVGIYSLSSNFSAVLALVFYALNNSWSPFYHEYSRTGQTAEMKKRAKNFFELFTVLACGFVLLAREVYHIFAEQSFWEGTELVFILAAGHYLVFLCSIPVNYEFFRQKTKMVAAGTVIAALVNVALNYILIRRMGYFGAAWATLVAHGVQLVLHGIFARRLGGTDYPFRLREFLPMTAVFLVITVFSALTPELALVRWLLGAALGVWELLRVVKRRSIF